MGREDEVKSPEVLDYAGASARDEGPVPKWAGRVSLVCAGMFGVYMTGLFAKSAVMVFLTPVVGVGAGVVGIVQACVRRSDPSAAVLGLVLNAAWGAFVVYLIVRD